MRNVIRALVAAGFSIVLTAAPTLAQWAEIPGTRFDQAKRADGSSLLISLPGGGETSTPIAIINAWNSAALDTDSARLLLVRHGGHADTAHNGVFAFDLATHRWLLLRETSRAYTPLPPTATSVYGPTYADGSPASVHTYDCEAYLPGVKRVYSGGGIYWSPAGESVPQVVWTWNTATREYERRQVRPGGYGCASVWDPVSNRLLLRLHSEWVQYNPSTDSYTTLFTATTGGDSAAQSTLFLDAAGRKVYKIDKRSATVTPRIRMVNLANLAAKEQTLLTEGDTAIETLAGVGGAFVNGRIVAFGRTADGTRGAAYTLIPNGCGLASQPKCRWIRYDPPSGPTPPRPDVNGMWKRAFVRGGLLYVLPAANENVWVLTMPWGASAGPVSGSPPPTTVPPPEPNPLPSPTPTPTPTPTPIPPTSEPAPTPTPSPSPSPSPTPPPPTTLTPFTVTVPIPNTDLSARWDAYPLWASGYGPMARGGKHARLAYDSRRLRMLLTGGDRDGSDAGNNSVWAFTVGGTATQLSPLCRPYPDWIPSFPDNMTWVYDSVRDRMLIMPGFFFDLSRLQTVCGRADNRVLRRANPDGTFSKDAGIFNLVSNAWAPPTWPFPAELGYGGDQQTNWGAYDPQKDMVVRFFWDGAYGNNLQRLHLATNTWSRFMLPQGTAGTTTERSRIRNTWATNSQPALDVRGRSVYVVASSNINSQVEWRLLRVNIDTGAAERIALPSGFVGPHFEDGGATELLLSFDPINRVLIHTLFPNLGGDISAVYISHVDIGHRWTTVPLPRNAPPLKGNVGGFDAGRGSLVLIGGHGVTKADGTRTPSPTHYWALTLRRG